MAGLNFTVSCRFADGIITGKPMSVVRDVNLDFPSSLEMDRS